MNKYVKWGLIAVLALHFLKPKAPATNTNPS